MTRITKRRYAHELYPHAEEYEIRPLTVEVPYLYARAIGFELNGTGWFDVEPRSVAGERAATLVDARRFAFLADAVAQGMTGDEAWTWAMEHASEESGELVAERATRYGVDWNAIKPYPCGPEPTHHDHLDKPDSRGWSTVTRIEGKESECPDCTEEEQP